MSNRPIKTKAVLMKKKKKKKVTKIGVVKERGRKGSHTPRKKKGEHSDKKPDG